MKKCFRWIVGRTLSALVAAVVLSRGVAHAGTIFLFDFGGDDGQNTTFTTSPADQRLNILFDQEVQYVQPVFASTAVGQGLFTALDGNLPQVGQSLAASVFPAGSATAEGTISFGGGAFRSLDPTFSSSNSEASFAIDDVANSVEPETLLFLGVGATMLGCTRRIRRSRP